MPIHACLHDGVPAVELTTPSLRLVAVHGFGPRIAWFGPAGGGNLLMWDDPAAPKYRRETPTGRAWTLRGGHRLWAAPGAADETEETYANDDAPGTCAIRQDGFAVIGALDPVSRTRRIIDVTVRGDDRLAVEHLLVNESDMLYGCGLWALTCTLPNASSRYVVPLGDGSSWDTATITVFRTWAGHGTGSFREEQGQLLDDAYLLTPRGRETKRMIQAPRGTIAMCDPERNLTFAITSAFAPGATYPANANLALYVGPNNFMVEMETMGPSAVLKSGQRIALTEEWRLLRGAVEPTGAAVLKALA